MFLSITTETGVKNINIYELQSYKSIDDETGKFIYYILDNGLTYKEYFDSDSDRDEKLSTISSMDPGTALVDSKIAEAIEHLDITTRVIVDSLPTEDIDTKTIYMVPNSTPGVQSNTYDEYMYINNAWEIVGSTAIDMTQYLSKTNTTSYTPTGDYNPTTKKYVDDSIAAIPIPTIETATDEDIDDLFPTPPVESLAIDLTDTSLWRFDSDCFYCDDVSEISRITNALSGQSTLSGELTYEDTTNVTYQGNYVFYNDAYTFVSSDGMSRFIFNLSEHEIVAIPVEYLNFDLTNENVWSSVGSEYVCIDENMPAEVYTKLQDHYTYPTTISYSPESDVTRTCIGNIFNYQVFVDSDGKCKFNVYSDSENLIVSDINNLYIDLSSNIYTKDSNAYTTTDADEWSKMTLYYNYLQYGAFTSQVFDEELSQYYTCDSYMGSELNTFNCRNLDRTPGNHDYLVSLDSSTHEVRVLLIGVE